MFGSIFVLIGIVKKERVSIPLPPVAMMLAGPAAVVKLPPRLSVALFITNWPVLLQLPLRFRVPPLAFSMPPVEFVQDANDELPIVNVSPASGSIVPSLIRVPLDVEIVP